ncbi:MAG: PH domain-containing protein [Actinomycetota bacterium]
MPFPARLLHDDEVIQLDINPHWWYLGSPGLVTVACLFGALVVNAQIDIVWLRDLLSYVFWAAMLVSAAWLIKRAVEWRTTYLVLTNQRLIYRQGVIARHGVEMLLEKVSNVNFSQTIFQRIVKAGSLLIESSGEQGQQQIDDIPDPESVQNIIHSAVLTRVRAATTFTAAPSVAADDVVSQLERLEALLDRGTITQVEFDRQKQRLLRD